MLQAVLQHPIDHILIALIAVPPRVEVPMCGLWMMYVYDARAIVGSGDKGKVCTRNQIIGASQRRGAAALKQSQ